MENKCNDSGIRCNDIISYMEELAPVKLAEEWDNVGLLVGDASRSVKKVLTCLDVTPEVLSQAVDVGADMIISHHPLIFKPLKRINAHDPKGRLFYDLIRNNISVYSAHTNLDIAESGLNEYLARLLKLKNIRGLNRLHDEALYKLAVYVPSDSAEVVREALCAAGAGWIGGYRDCTFMSDGTGTFKPLSGTNPYIGKQDHLERTPEIKIETVVPQGKLSNVISAMLQAHPYEEVAYDTYVLENKGKAYSLGRVGELDTSLNISDFTELLKSVLHIQNVRIVGKPAGKINRVAVFTGSFDGDLSGVLVEKAEILVTGDLKYHTAMEILEKGICAIDAGHFGTERIAASYLAELLSNRFPGIEVISNTVETDPFIFS